MHITLLTSGSRGDVQPYIALGLALKRAGAGVRLATFENYASFVQAHGLEFFPIPGDISSILASADVDHARKADNPLKFLLSFNKLKQYVFDLQQSFYDACAGSEALVYHPGVALGYFAARHMRIPGILALPFPMTPTRAYPSMIFYDTVRLGGAFNLLSHKLLQNIMWMVSNQPVKQFWKQKFGRLPDDFGNPFPKQTLPAYPTIVSCSNYIFPASSDFPPNVHHTGFWFVDEEAGWTPPADLLAFLQNGPAPVYVGFGSLSDASTTTTDLIIEALQRSGQRGVIATGVKLAPRLNLPEGIFILESAPHAWLFPRMAAVVHHGGAGTTAAGFRAGVPQVVIPHSNDQFAWGKRVHELGVGVKPIPRRKLTAENLAEGIRGVLMQPVKDAAKELGRKIQSENGAETAARVVLNCITAQPAL
ncbi:MAG: glycosyltransferase [Chloroflexota bacterium]|jgi:sterol 3beta-glucosyltransferase